MRTQRIKLAYLFVCLFHLAALLYFKEPNWLYVVSKLTLMPLLIALAWNYKLATRVFKRKWSLIMSALVFSFLGDLFLLKVFVGDIYFILGLSSFLICHTIYIRCFIGGKWHLMKPSAGPVIMAILLILIWATWFYMKLFPELGTMLLPVSIYIAVISLMAISAVLRYTWASRLSFAMVLLGALFFMLSDSMVAWQVFIGEFNYGSVLIMATYLFAQFMIVEGLHKQDLLVQAER